MQRSDVDPTELAIALHYKASPEGICYGYAALGLQAIIIDELQKFAERNQLMSDKAHELGIQGLANALLGIEQKRIQIINEEKNKLRKNLEMDEYLTDEEFDDLLKDNEDPLVMEFNQFLQSVDTKLPDEMKPLIDMHAAIQLMVLYASPQNYSMLYEKNAAPLAQKILPGLSIGLPDSLLKNDTREEKKEVHASPYRKKIPLIKQVTTVAGLYNENELTAFFEQLRLNTQQYIPPVVFLLNGKTHTVSVAYDSRKLRWEFIDIKQMPLVEYITDREIAKAVLHSLSENNIATFTTEIYCHEKQANELNMVFYHLTQSAMWDKLHNVDGKENLKDSHGDTLLYTATANGNLDVVKSILKKKIDPEQIFHQGASPFLLAAGIGNAAIVKEFLKYKNGNINTSDSVGCTAMYMACQNNFIDVVKLLLNDNEHSLNPFIALNNGTTPFFIAAQNGHHEIVKLLIERYPVNKLKSSICMTVEALLWFADYSHRKDYVNELIQYKMGDQKFEIHNFTPLHAAIFFGNLDVVKTMIKAGFSIYQKTQEGISGLDFAIAMNHTEIIAELKRTMASHVFDKLNINLEFDEIVQLAIDTIAHAEMSMTIVAESIYQNIRKCHMSEKYQHAMPKQKVELLEAAIHSAAKSDSPEEKVKQYFVSSFSKQSSNDSVYDASSNPPHQKKKK